jgi:hypothetical protein
MSPEEVAHTGADRELTLGWWWRWGLLVGVGALVVLITVASLFS